MNQINNIEDLRNTLINCMEKVQSNEMDLKTAKIIVANSNAILKTTKQQLDNREYLKDKQELSFFKINR